MKGENEGDHPPFDKHSEIKLKFSHENFFDIWFTFKMTSISHIFLIEEKSVFLDILAINML